MPKHSRYILPRPQFSRGLNAAQPVWYKLACRPFYMSKDISENSFLKEVIDIEWECTHEGHLGQDSKWIIFHGASYYGNMELVEYMVSNPRLGINNNRNNIHQTVLLSAIYGNQIEVIKRLLEHPLLNVNKRGHYGIFPLQLAVSKGYIEIVKLLLNHPKIHINQRTKQEVMTDLGRCLEFEADPYTYTALDIAAMRGKREILTLLLEKGADVSNALFHASRTGNLEIVEILLPIPGIKREESLQLAAFHGHFWVVERLLKEPEIGNDESYCMYALERALDIYSDDLHALYEGYNKEEMIGKKLCAYILMNHHSKRLNRYLIEIDVFTTLPKLPIELLKKIYSYAKYVHPHFQNKQFLKDWKRLTSIDTYAERFGETEPDFESEDVSRRDFPKYAFHTEDSC